jgi:hypothetical protein
MSSGSCWKAAPLPFAFPPLKMLSADEANFKSCQDRSELQPVTRLHLNITASQTPGLVLEGLTLPSLLLPKRMPDQKLL